LRALIDVNVLIALFDAAHVHHDRARAWWRANREAGWASCSLTQNGFVRVVSHPSYPKPVSLGLALEALAAQTALPEHEFWSDDVSITDGALFDRSRLYGPRQITDAYLLAPAVRHGGRLVTFDDAIALAAVRGARPENLVVL
jgi:hypothetical protein